MSEAYLMIGAFLCGLVAWVQAVAKGRSGWWFLAGLFVPVLSNLLLAVASDLNRERELHKKVDEVLKRIGRGKSSKSGGIGGIREVGETGG